MWFFGKHATGINLSDAEDGEGDRCHSSGVEDVRWSCGADLLTFAPLPLLIAVLGLDSHVNGNLISWQSFNQQYLALRYVLYHPLLVFTVNFGWFFILNNVKLNIMHEWICNFHCRLILKQNENFLTSGNLLPFLQNAVIYAFLLLCFYFFSPATIAKLSLDRFTRNLARMCLPA